MGGRTDVSVPGDDFDAGPRRPPRTLAGFLRAAALLLLVLAPCALHFWRGFAPAQLDAAGFDQVQAARYTAVYGRLFTQVLRPLEVGRLACNPENALPDFRHSPLYTGVCAAAIRALGQTGAGDGDRATALVGMGLLMATVALAALLAQVFFPRRNVWRAAAFVALGGSGLALILKPNAAVLGGALMGMLCLLLFHLDGRPLWDRPAPRWLALAAGLVAGLLVLSVYSFWIVVPALLWHLWRVTRRDVRATALALLGILLACAPGMWRAWRVTRNPLYHARFVELAMHTETYPGDQLYRYSNVPRPMSAFLGAEGAVQVARKAGRGLAGVVPRAIAIIGPLPLLLFLAGGLLRFADQRVNALRNLLFVALPLHALGLSLFVLPEDAAPALWIYAPPACVLAAAFLETVIVARRLPRLHALGLLWGWSLLGCLPGIAALLGGAPAPRSASKIYELLTAVDSESFPQVRDAHAGVLAANNPAEAAFFLDVPVAALPADAAEFELMESRLPKPVAGFVLTRDTRLLPLTDTASRPWLETYERVVGLWYIFKNMTPEQQRDFQAQVQVRYPPAIEAAVQEYLPRPFLEEIEGGYSLIFWKREFLTPSGAATTPRR